MFLSYLKSTILLIVITFIVGCCVPSKCRDEKINVIPFFDGFYQILSVPTNGFYIKVDGKKLYYINEAFPSPIDCNSDLPSINLECCKKYTFELYVDYENIPDKMLNSASIKISNKGNCFIPDIDPNNNR